MSMEVASPLNLSPTPGATKRPLAYSPMDSTYGDSEMSEEHLRSVKRRKFREDESMETLSTAFSSHSPFQNQSNSFLQAGSAFFKRPRPDGKELSTVVEEQRVLIESLKNEKEKLEASFKTLKTESDRSAKENQLLRKAITIQEERRNQAEQRARDEYQGRLKAEEDVRKMEQVILSLRYHLQTQQSHNMSNDFMGMPPSHPDVF